jgi:hypothetical protein
MSMGSLMDEEEQARKQLEEFKAEIDLTTAKITEKTYESIGRSITDWSQMEGSLVHIASWLLDSRSQKVGLVLYSINNFHTWLSIIDELFAMDPNFSPLRSDWIKIAERLRKLNDVRVRLAHHALEPGKDPLELLEDDSDPTETFPSLKPNKADTRMKWKKNAIGLEEIATFRDLLIEVIEEMTTLMSRMGPIYLGPKRKLVAKVKELQQKVAQQEQTP